MMDWESAYQSNGDIQTRISDLVKDSVGLFRERNARKVLDLGCGTGRHTIFLAENGFDVYGTDISKTGIEITEKRLKEKKLIVHLKIADMHEIPFEDNFFDVVISIYTIPHTTLAGLRKIVSEIWRVLKPKGILVTTLVSTKDLRYGTGKEIEPNTFTNLDDPAEGDVPHHFSDENEVKELFARFNLIKSEESEGYSPRRKIRTVHWHIIAEKV